MNLQWQSRWLCAWLCLAVPSLIAACGGGNGGSTAVTDSPATNQPTVTLLAGSLQRAGNQDGVAQDAAGNAYVADTDNHTIRKIGTDGIVTTWAGAAGQSGTSDGPALGARFSSPRGLAIDAAGSVYVADSGNNTIRKITASGVVSTVAGAAGQAGSIDGTAATARFQSPIGVAVDSTGNIYVVDGNTLRKVAADGTVTTFTTQPERISAVATDAADNVYVAGYLNRIVGFTNQPAIRKFGSNGSLIPWGAGAEGSVLVEEFAAGLAADRAGNVYVAVSGVIPTGNPSFYVVVRKIMKISPAGEASIVAGASNTVAGDSSYDARMVDGPAATARFRDPRGISVSSEGRLVVTDSSAVRAISAQGIVTTLAAGSDGDADGPGAAARFFSPSGLAAAADGTLFVADSGNKSVRKISPGGSVSTLALSGYDFCRVDYIALSPTGTLILQGPREIWGRTLCTVDPTGVRSEYPDGSFFSSVAFDAQGRVLFGQGRLSLGGQGQDTAPSIVRINADGSRQVLASGFEQVSAIAANAAGVVYVVDEGDHTVRAVATDGTVTLLAGQPGKPGYADGAGASAQLNYPGAITLDEAGNLYVADATTIRRITPQGEVRTVAGVAGQSGVQPGPALAPLGRAAGLAWSLGALYAAVQNAVIRIDNLN